MTERVGYGIVGAGAIGIRGALMHLSQLDRMSHGRDSGWRVNQGNKNTLEHTDILRA